MVGLYFGDDIHLAGAFDVTIGHDLRVHESEAPVGFAVLRDDAFQHVHQIAVGLVADRVDRQLDAGGVGLKREALEAALHFFGIPRTALEREHDVSPDAAAVRIVRVRLVEAG